MTERRNKLDAELGDDWLHGVFGVFREEVISIAADFGQRVKNEIDVVADMTDLQPPSAAALLTSVAIESSNIATSLLSRDDEPYPPPTDDQD